VDVDDERLSAIRSRPNPITTVTDFPSPRYVAIVSPAGRFYEGDVARSGRSKLRLRSPFYGLAAEYRVIYVVGGSVFSNRKRILFRICSWERALVARPICLVARRNIFSGQAIPTLVVYT
jgi:hypothetical protein